MTPSATQTQNTSKVLAQPRAELAHTGLRCTPDKAWLLVEEGFALAREREIESLLAIGNGYVGNRASLAEGSRLSAPATFAAGIFIQPPAPGAVPELLVLPDWTGVRIWIERQPLSMQEGQVLEHRRILDMRQGVLWREWRHQDPHGRITCLTSLRLASLADRHLLLQWLALRPENYSGTVVFESSMELAPSLEPFLPPDWKTRRPADRPNVLPLALRTPGREYRVAMAAASQLLTSASAAGKRDIELQDRRVLERFEVSAPVGAECQLQRVVAIYSSRDLAKPFQAAVAHVNRVCPSGFESAAAAHAGAWQSRFASSDVQVEGEDFLQSSLRFAEYHLTSAANPEDDRVSIGARALTGEAYKGHVFWDTELYMLPFFVHTHPASARALLSYRYHTLDGAREKARSAGFAGAMYPWESADTGEETTPRAVITPAGEVIRVLNGEMEIHISADVAFAVWQYWRASGDDDFLCRAGAEILLETARFWASRGSMESDGAYHIRHVIGPDEYHDDVDDNAFTNLMAAWNLRHGTEAARILQQRWPEIWHELADRLRLSDSELAAWPKLADAMFTGFDPQTGLFEQFTGYFAKEAVDLKSYEPRSAAMDVILGHHKIQQTNVVKQADVVMAMYLLWDDFPAQVRAANFRYYEPRTGHGSSLSPAIHALMAARFGDTALGQRYLRQSAEIDLRNNMGNASGGVHAAALGGLWQAMVFGFAGVQVRSEGIAFAPALLPDWRRLAFPLQWRNRLLRVSIEPNSMHVAVQGAGPVKLGLKGSTIVAEPGREYAADRGTTGWNSWRLVQ
jgi:trehalose/maltose hydrolase-like predicted phosphorylase